MRLHRWTLATLAATFLLILAGGLMSSTGSALACPDWPLCASATFPEMRSGVHYAQAHRAAAVVVALMTMVLAVLAFRRRDDPALRWLGILAVGLVTLQGVLGGVAVLLRLPVLVSTAHLALSMTLLVFLVYLAFRTAPGRAVGRAAGDAQPGGPGGGWLGRTWVLAAVAAVFVQVLLGAFVDSSGAGPVCGNDVVLCEGAAWPKWLPAQLHMAHRYFAIVVFALVTIAHLGALGEARREERTAALVLARLAPLLVVAQIALGLWTVRSYDAVPVVTAHLGLGALLLADVFALYVALGPAGRRAAAPVPETGGLGEATT